MKSMLVLLSFCIIISSFLIAQNISFDEHAYTHCICGDINYYGRMPYLISYPTLIPNVQPRPIHDDHRAYAYCEHGSHFGGGWCSHQPSYEKAKEAAKAHNKKYGHDAGYSSGHCPLCY